MNKANMMATQKVDAEAFGQNQKNQISSACMYRRWTFGFVVSSDNNPSDHRNDISYNLRQKKFNK